MRNKRKFLQTDFIKFILEKYSQDGQELPEEDETETPSEEEPQLRKKNKIKKLNEFEDEEEGEIVQNEEEPEGSEVDDEIIDELLNEYKRLKKKYESNRFRYRRK